MIIELLGPSAAGKTTLAHELAAALRNKGCKVRLVASSRPAERPARVEDAVGPRRLAARVLAPLSRAAKLASAVSLLLPGTRLDPTVAALLKLMPPPDLISHLRFRRYLSLLCASWRNAARFEGVTIFDQGFLLALSSLFLLARSRDESLLDNGVKLTPRAELVVHLSAPSELLQRRLRERLQAQSAAERLLERDLHSHGAQIRAVETLRRILREQGEAVMDVNCLERQELASAVDRIVAATTAQLDFGLCRAREAVRGA